MVPGRPTSQVSPTPFTRLFTRLPKVEIHLHLEGTLSVARLRRWWPRLRDPELPSDPARLFQHRDFPEFLKHFGAACRAIRGPEELAEMTRDLSRSLKRQGVVAAEVFFTPIIFTRRGLPFLELFQAIEETAIRESKRGGPDLNWILDGVRQWGPRGFEELMECAQAVRKRILGIGVGGDEGALPTRQFLPFFEEARRLGLHTVAHAGEFCSARSVSEAVETLGAERIGHGFRAMEDPGVVRLLKRRGIPLEVCPTSNLRTRVIRRWRDHPLPRMIEAGLRLSLNSDDPGLFKTSLLQEYRSAHRRMGLGAETLYQRHRDGIQASFLSANRKRELLERSNIIWEEERIIQGKHHLSAGSHPEKPSA